MGCHNFFAHGLESLRAAGVIAHITSASNGHVPPVGAVELLQCEREGALCVAVLNVMSLFAWSKGVRPWNPLFGSACAAS